MRPPRNPISRRAVLTAAGAGLLTAGCAKLQSHEPSRPRRSGRMIDVTIGYNEVPDAAPLLLAAEDGLFARHGLRVKLHKFTKPIDARDPGSLPDIVHLSWAFMLAAIGEGADWKIIGEAYEAVDGCTGLYVPDGSSYRWLQDRARPRIATNTPIGLGSLLSKARLQAAGIRANDISFKAMMIPEMPAALAAGNVDAAWLPEPLITQYALEHGLQPLVDTTTGDTANFPLSGYSCTRTFAANSPDVVQEFQDVMALAQERAATDRAAVERVFQRSMGLSPMTTALMTIGTFPLSLEAARPQRVADLLHTNDVVPRRLDVASLVWAP